ncbi:MULTISPECIES: CamS family sex pheromone protein [Bacillus]|uniref:CamS family sex pheromone protein n=1 Tax=Bacillus TaxID=1386 RepID=UPI00033131FF|nr:CamS family sex pheromone protein [Bacillus wiedmannii]EOP13999.1 sex pheromone [Bacillus cereus BAG2O-3]EOQ08915.1 sex pheromone [Bacillus cereus B5-2]MDA1600838.1 CamS family sex pheromone protein [Bacillus cereus]PFW76347.1 sex pheromone [Bacillus sp. AFS075960]RFB50720.1 sex pheromone [Bacillus sp. dmp10]RFB77702.1 sex pheromone [Bacillus sp. AW]HDR8173376.1 CamS family sex pheromone protein [Bacillus thuringiensis]
MKKMALSFAVVSLLLGACSNDTISKKDEVIQKDTKEKSMIPRTAVSKDYYRTVIPLKEQKVINTANIKTNSKLDLAEYENGLMNIATQQFDTENHVLQLNQYIPEKLVDELVAKVEAPVLTNIIEQDYFGKQNSNELSLSGVMIGLAMSSSVSNEEAMSKGTEVAKQLIEAINKNDKYNKSPITFAIFKQESTSSLKNGTYIASTTVQKNDTNLGNWSTIDEQAYSYPSDEFKQAHGEDNTKITEFAKTMKEFSPGDFIPVNAKVSYKKNQMDALNMNIVIKYNGKTELMALTQMAAQSMLEKLPKDAKVQLQIKSESKIEAIIIKEKNSDKPFVSFL